MAKMENIRKYKSSDNQLAIFSYFPMISIVCTGSGYEEKS
ncbi:hypothetical protein HMPREF1205_01308 [Bacteroides fragilis HMW 616]|jgi:hypothetical protein|nr:hypothetical protein HMPREF1205_01308 [Bacteroides fragilis HMW 616]